MSSDSRPISQMFQVSGPRNNAIDSYISNIEVSQSSSAEPLISKKENEPNNTNQTLENNFPTVERNSSELNKYLSSLDSWRDLGPEALTKQIRILCEQLMAVPQESLSTEESENLAIAAKSLCASCFLESKNQNIRILSACCLADILRLFAPETPFSKDELKRIFPFFIRQLSGLENFEGSLFPWYFYLLERLATTKAFALVANDEEISVDLLEKCFTIISENHSYKVHLYLTELMANVVEEADQISQSVLDAALMRLIPPFSQQSPESYKLAKMLVLRCKDSLQLPVSSFLNAVFVDKRTVDSDLRDRVHDLVQQLFYVAPDLLLYVFPGLEAELKVEDVNVRTKSIRLLGKLFSSSDSNLFEKYATLFDELLGRFYDVEPSIRVELCILAESILRVHPNVSTKIQKYLQERVLDTDEKVRETAIQKICSNWNAFSVETLKSVVSRLYDKKARIRKETIQQITKAFLQELAMVEKNWNKNKEQRKELSRKLSWVPEELLIAYERLHRENDDESCFMIERFIFFEEAKTFEGQANLMFYVENVFWTLKNGKKVFESLIAKHRKANKCLSYLLSIIDKNNEAVKANAADSNEGNAADVSFNEAIQVLAKALEHKRAEELLHSVFRTKNRSIVKHLRSICSLYSSTSDKLASIESLRRVFHTRTELWSFIESCFLCRCSCLLFNKVSAVELLDSIRSNSSKTSSCLGKTKLQFDFSLIFARHFPEFFDDQIRCIEELLRTFSNEGKTKRRSKRNKTARAACEKEGYDLAYLLRVLELLFYVAKDLQSTAESNLWQLLSEISLKDTLPQEGVKYAIGSLAQMFGHSYSDISWRKFIERVLSQPNWKLNLDEDRISRILCIFSQLVKHGPVKSVESLEEIVCFSLEEILNPAGKTFKSHQIYVLAIKLIGNLVINSEDLSTIPFSPKLILDILFDILRRRGNVKGTLNNSNQQEATDSFGDVRLSCAKVLLKMQRKSFIKEFFGPFEFLEVGLTIQDPIPEVRLKFMQRLCKELLHHRLSFKWFSFFALTAVDPDKTNYTSAVRLASKVVQIRHLYVNQVKNQQVSNENDFGHSFFSLLPECNLMHLVWILAHHPDFQTDKVQDNFADTSKCLDFFFERILETRQDHAMFLQQILRAILLSEDATESSVSSGTEAIREVAQVALTIMKKKQEGKKWDLSEYTGMLILPASMYRMTATTETNKRKNLTVSDDSGPLVASSFRSNSNLEGSLHTNMKDNSPWKGAMFDFADDIVNDENVVANTQLHTIG
ncbi:Sister chromatid cohesion protein PDS5 homolog A [Galdieria sulphuraria]|nr:Sister chromatid cohesion protein PDS5 homolog A [Galdieria sulphuraria]